tara:strand:+ start:377 stop:511 length:135 start_codon:yes stop_codon:yes gene_type:complete
MNKEVDKITHQEWIVRFDGTIKHRITVVNQENTKKTEGNKLQIS